MSDSDNKPATLAEQTEKALNDFVAALPEQGQQVVGGAFERLMASDVAANAVGVGDKAIDFSLPNARGGELALADKLSAGPVVLNFFRGGWCPFCSLEFAALQRKLGEIEALGASLVGVSPERLDTSVSTLEQHQLRFDVLSDRGNRVAAQYGLVMEVDPAIRPMYLEFGFDLPRLNGDDSWVLPVPATYVIGADGVVKAAFVDKDYTHRMEPTDIVAALQAL